MKLIRYIPFFSIVLCLFTVVAAADSNKKGKVTFSDHVVVSGTQLEPGEYLVRWDGSGPGVQIRFLHDGEEVTSVAGNVVQQKNPRNSFTTNSGENGSRVLTQIAFSDVILVLAPGETSTPQ
jgi:hypothetical protein